ncbi:MAG TPA: oligopeptide transporter, OPT family [Verrucomicrobiae bacterium]|jgi:putative OPT family oligopeptide transporter|nr:oligopeptide transporter, OPT family [Verrucomicrobiae bacterium]
MASLTRSEIDGDPAPRPFIAAETKMRECTPRAIILGAILGMVFGASSLYLVLKVGITVSASIPVAVISLTLFRLWNKFGGKDATVLENNIVQTAGSAGESIAFGLGVTMPAIMILGFDLEITRPVVVGLLGALLGIFMMIPLRRALIVQQHRSLKYPEGTACAEVLKAGANEESRAASQYAGEKQRVQQGGAAIFAGFGVGLIYKTAMSAFKAWKDTPEKIFGPPFVGGSISAEISPELLGVGYIIGPRISCIMAAGGVLSYLVLIPMIKFFGGAAAGAVAPGLIPIKDMGPDDIRGAYILYIGAGAVAAGGIISLLTSLPLIWRGIRAGLSDFGAAAAQTRASAARTERDLSMKVVAFGCLALVIAIWATPSLNMNALGAALIVVFGFLFVTVSSRLTGEIGSSSNPISGMTVATLLLTCLVFLLAGWTGVGYYVTALSVGGIVCVAASNGGATSQDLKTGFLLGATPKYQQIAIMIGAALSAVALSPILIGLNAAGTVYEPINKVAPGLHAPANTSFGAPEPLIGPQSKDDSHSYRVWHKTDDVGGREGRYLVDDSGAAVYYVDEGINGEFKTRPDGTEVRKYSAPKAVLMSYIIKGILHGNLPWALVLLGVMISVVLELSGIPSLAFAVGVYLPISSSTPLMVGGLIRWLVDRGQRVRLRGLNLSEEQLSAESDKSPGVLLASGYIAGGAIAGIIIAFMAGALHNADSAVTKWAEASNPFYAGASSDLLALIPFVLLSALLYLVGRRSTA